MLAASTWLLGQSGKVEQGQPLWRAEGIWHSIENAAVTADGAGFLVKRQMQATPIIMTFSDSHGVGVSRENNQWWVLPIATAGEEVEANTNLWVLPADAMSKKHAWYIDWRGGSARAIKTEAGLRVLLNVDSVTVHSSEARPHSDLFGNRFVIEMPGGTELEDALAGFYWGTMLPSVVEKTMAAKFPYSSGYVLSTLKTSAYAGSYPAVDHEFQIKGRLAIGSEVDLDIVRRMIELQLKLMDDDPERLSRAPTSVQPDGRREYHVRRNSKNNKENAAMFPLTGNIEVLEEAWHYYEARKDSAWLREHIVNLEDAATWTLSSMDKYGRVWSDVYYEDQVMKDGRETQAQAFAAYTFALLSKMETVVGRKAKAAYYTGISKQIAHALVKPLPIGYWDEKKHQFIDWIDRNGEVHDHLHLLANTLPVLLGYTSSSQTDAVQRLVDDNAKEFERFPSFLSADIAAYTDSEIGDGGPYDLSAAGRYWYWDAAYRASRSQNDLLFEQLKMVAAEAAKDNYFMGERYDMDHVYYIDGKNAHGAEKYYEYPNVYSAVLVSKFLGLSIPSDANVSVAPHPNQYGAAKFETPEYNLSYRYSENDFVLKNLSRKQRRFKVDLSSLSAGHHRYLLAGRVRGKIETITLAGGQEARWNRER